MFMNKTLRKHIVETDKQAKQFIVNQYSRSEIY